MEKVSVVIPVYGQWHLLKRNIDGLLKYDGDRISEIIVVDDCSVDPNPYRFDDAIVRITRNEKNLGYTGTVNNGLRRASARIIVLLDSDAYPLGPFVEKLVGMYDADTSIGCIGFGTVDDTGRDTGNYQYEPSAGELIVGQQLAAKLGFLRFWRNKNKLPYSCAVSFTQECIAGLDYLDGNVFPVLDADNDISMRIHRSKWKLVFTKEIMICHSGGNSYKINYKRVLLFHESRWKLLKKYRLIMFPGLTKLLIKTRISMECLVFKILLFVEPGNGRHEEKMRGRQMLMNAVKEYK
jgi:glycosyltransferase involved in cell wall biosynthesis